MNVLVVGATGVLGTEICRRLKAKGHDVRGLVRAGSSKGKELQALGVKIVEGDLRNPATLPAATQGVQAVISTATAVVAGGSDNSLRQVDRDGHLALIDAAKKAGVGHFIQISLSPSYPGSAPLVAYKREVSDAIKASGMTYTILQPSYFMEVWFSNALGWDLDKGKAQIFGKGEAKSSWISLHDVADYTVFALEDPRARNREIPLGGPKPLSALEVVEIFEKAKGQPFKRTHLPGVMPTLLSKVLKPFNPKLSSLMSLGAQSTRGDVIDMEPVIAEFGRPSTSVADYAKKVFKR